MNQKTKKKTAKGLAKNEFFSILQEYNNLNFHIGACLMDVEIGPGTKFYVSGSEFYRDKEIRARIDVRCPE